MAINFGKILTDYKILILTIWLLLTMILFVLFILNVKSFNYSNITETFTLKKRKNIDDKANKSYVNLILNDKKLIEKSIQNDIEVKKLCKEVYSISNNSSSKYNKYKILKNVITSDECKWIIYESEKYASKKGWTKKRHEDYPTVDIEVIDMPKLKQYVYNLITIKIFPEFAELYNLEANKFGVNESFVVKYNMNGQEFLSEHQDESEFSFILGLNNEFRGGGTKFKREKDVIRLKEGECLIFSGQQFHEGKAITSGQRYILVGFMNYGGEGKCRSMQ